MTVIQTGAIAAVSFVFGDYASEILRLGQHSSAIYAALGILLLTVLNVAGTVEAKLLQKLMQFALFAGLIFIGVAGLLAGAPAKPATAASGGPLRLAMIFVLPTHRGRDETAHLSGGMRQCPRHLVRVPGRG